MKVNKTIEVRNKKRFEFVFRSLAAFVSTWKHLTDGLLCSLFLFSAKFPPPKKSVQTAM